MKELVRRYDRAKRYYSDGKVPTDAIRAVVCRALELLAANAVPRFLSACDGKEYHVYEAAGRLTRPYVHALLELDAARFTEDWEELVDSAHPDGRRFTADSEFANRVIYTAVGSFALCYDLWKPTSRKTPGTFFEVLIGTLVQLALLDHTRSGHVILPDQAENVSTDIVFRAPERPGGLVLPVKITTRERIVQPFAHQRILESVFGRGVYRSALICMSEMQRDGDNNANAICVPGTVRLFQGHLAALGGLYYLDPPARYLDADVTGLVTVGTVGQLLSRDLPGLTAEPDDV